MKSIDIWIPLLLTFLAGLATVLGSLIALSLRGFKDEHLRFSLGVSAGVMVYISFAELLKTAVEKAGFLTANIAFFGGIALIMLVDFVIPHKYIIEEPGTMEHASKKLFKAGMFTALGVAIHNIPEGLAVFVSSLGGIKLGVALAFAIGIHNIPEGIAISMPIYHATRSRKKALWYSFLAGIVEPVGALIGIVILMPFISQTLLALSFAFAAGIMVFISFDELLPLAYTHKDNHITIAGIITGMFIMALSLVFL